MRAACLMLALLALGACRDDEAVARSTRNGQYRASCEAIGGFAVFYQGNELLQRVCLQTVKVEE